MNNIDEKNYSIELLMDLITATEESLTEIQDEEVPYSGDVSQDYVDGFSDGYKKALDAQIRAFNVILKGLVN